MGTRSFIATRNPKGDYTAIYCHWDGYPNGCTKAPDVGVGYTLRTFYKSKGKVRQLVRLGDISSLGRNIAAIGPHSFDSPQDSVTVAYGRDRGDKNCKAQSFDSLKELADYAAGSWAEYIYVFDGKRWHWADIEAAVAGKPLNTFI